MTWAWTVPLSPSPKFVLMALADEADDSGFCFPSHRRIALKCTITERSVRRMIRLLAERRYLVVHQRFNNRARTSNGYQLAVDLPRTNCPGEPNIARWGDRTLPSGGSGRSRPGAQDSTVRVTTTYPLFDPTPPQLGHPDADQNAALERLQAVVVVVISAFQRRCQTRSARRYKRVSARLASRMRSWSWTSSLVE